MKTLPLLATAAVLSAVATPSFAVVYTMTDNLTGAFSASGFQDANPNTYNINVRDLDGTVKLYTPPAGSHTTAISGSLLLNLLPGSNPALSAPWDVAFSIPAIANIFTAVLSGVADTGVSMFTFQPGTPGANDGVAIGSGTFRLTYDEQIAPEIQATLYALTGMAMPSSGAGSIDVLYSLFQDGFDLEIRETATTWPGFGAALAAINSAVGSTPNLLTGDFSVNQLQVSSTQVPEPTTLALLGIGVAGLGTLRRRRQA
tara:strand:- start:47037 stop:47810 length:774 start_codon:yes stop_codon:yes gene_type:complete